MSLHHPPHDLAYETFVNERIAPRGRVHPLHSLVSFVRRHAKCLRRKAVLTRDESSLLDLLAAIERSYVLLLFSGTPWHDAEEVIQTSLEKLYERQDKIPPEKRAAWLKAAVRTTNLERRRTWATEQGFAPEVARELAEQLGSVHRPADVQIGTFQLHADTQRLFRLLRLEEQTVVDLCAFQDMTMEEVAATLGIPKATVRKRWRLAVDRLCEHIEREDVHERFQSGGFNRYVFAAAALLWLRARGWFRRIADFMGEETAGATRAARWPIVAIAVPLLALPVLVLLPTAPRASEVSSVDEATASADATVSSVGLFLSTWAEHERERPDPIVSLTSSQRRGAVAEKTLLDKGATKADAAPKKAEPVATTAATASQQVAPEAPTLTSRKAARTLLDWAQAALAANALEAASRALQRYEVEHSDDPYPALHASLRVDLALKSIPR